MPTLSKPEIIRERITSVNGEVTVNFNITLSLKLDQSGNIVMSSNVSPEQDDKFIRQIPKIDVGSEDMISFGKDV